MMGLTCRHIFAVYIKKDISQFKILEFNTRWLALRQNINKTDNYVVNLAELREILNNAKEEENLISEKEIEDEEKIGEEVSKKTEILSDPKKNSIKGRKANREKSALSKTRRPKKIK